MKANAGAIEAWADELRRGAADPGRRAVLVAELRRELPSLVDQLERGWGWCEANRDHARVGEYENRWISWLRLYEQATGALAADGRAA